MQVSMRAVITIVAVVIAIIFGVALATRSPRQDAARPTPAEVTPAPERAPDTAITPPAVQEEAPPPTGAEPAGEDVTFEPIAGLRAQPAAEAVLTTLGALDPQVDAMQVEFTGWGAGIYRITLSRYMDDMMVDGERQPLEIQQPISAPDGRGGTDRRYAFAAHSIVVNGEPISLEAVRWRNIAPGHYAITLVDADDQPVLRITRLYELSNLGPERGHDLICFQTFENLGERPLRVQWNQNGQSQLPIDTGYLGDRRQVMLGYYNLDVDPGRVRVYTDRAIFTHSDATRRMDDAAGDWIVWPGVPAGPRTVDGQTELAWLSMVNRYFAVALHQPVRVPEDDSEPRVVPPLDRDFPSVHVRAVGVRLGDRDPRELYTVLSSRTVDLMPGDDAELNIALFAGPRKRELFAQPPYSWMHFNEMIRYSLGGPCAACTFQWLARGLLSFLKWIHTIVHDWAISIIILVLIVRGLLHPITKRAQINMTKMGKQMQALAPEMDKLKVKYKDNPQKLQQETMALYREKGINPANLLGCLPMFLQMPIWLALYSMLAFAIELRHEPAFYGIFQTIGNWTFLNDLSSPDRFVQFTSEPRMFFFFDYSSLNVLPLLMGIVFYINMKLTTPPPANEQAEQQQKIMKWMMLLFPFILYSAPSGLTLYILASTCAGIVDSYFVRSYIKREEEAGTLFKKKERKPGGFMDRMRKAVEERQRQIQKMQDQKKRGDDGPSRKKRK